MDHRIVKDLRDLASLCRRSAERSDDPDCAASFLKIAEEIEADVARMEARQLEPAEPG